MDKSISVPDAKLKLLRCADWLLKQNNQELKKLSLQNKNVNDIQFILETNAKRRNFLITSAEDEATVPAGIDEPQVEPKAVPLHRLRTDKLHIECEWLMCRWSTSNYDAFQKHVFDHVVDLHVLDVNGKAQYVCLWDICGHKTMDFNEIVRHLNYHAYRAKLLAIGFNGRATLRLACCKKDSSKRNQLPPLKNDHFCMWTGCQEKFCAVQDFFDHVRMHGNYAEVLLCSWAGCGAKFNRRIDLHMHLRTHTGERLIACYHCGQHFANNRKLCDHLRRQNAHASSGFNCTMCGIACATEYLLREHTRRHVSVYACTMCDMSAPSLTSLATHIRYRHLGSSDLVRQHACHLCPYRAITKWDLRKHILTHTRKKKIKKRSKKTHDDSSEQESTEDEVECKPKVAKKYVCHMCPQKEKKIFNRGTYLTKHLVKMHGAQWPFGHSRFRYQISEDGMYRLTTTRYESLEVSKKIVDGTSAPITTLNNSLKFDVVLKSKATDKTPAQFEIAVKGEFKDEKPCTDNGETQAVEITMCDVDADGNIISSEVIKSDVFFT